MKLLLEIINLQRTTTNVPKFDEKKLKTHAAFNYGVGGIHAGGSTDKQDPHIFNKTTYYPKPTLKADPYYQYIRACAKYAKSNPFFPRVYEINTEIDPTGQKRPIYKIESLIHYNQLTTKMLITAGKLICPELRDIINKTISNYKHGDINYDEYDEAIDLKNAVGGDIATYLYELIDGIETTDNQKLVLAIYVIQKVFGRNSKFVNDMHYNNFMFRRTPYGPQLVLTDPLSGGQTR